MTVVQPNASSTDSVQESSISLTLKHFVPQVVLGYAKKTSWQLLVEKDVAMMLSPFGWAGKEQAERHARFVKAVALEK
jgi:hypothetical protein